MSMTSTVSKVISLSIYSILKGEHNEISMMLATLEATPNNMGGARENLLKSLREELVSHGRAEEKTVYKQFEEKSENAMLVDEAEEDHARIEGLLMELTAMDQESEDWKPKLTALKNQIETHVKEEEDEMFTDMKQVFSDDEAKALGKEFREEKQRQLDMMRS